MKISELSAAAELPTPTIKYYLREGLLPAGEPTAANQADYGDDHIHRLRLIRALVEVGGLSLTAVRAVLVALDDETTSLHRVLGVAHYALAKESVAQELSCDEAAVVEVDRFLDRIGWRVSPDAPAKQVLARTLTTLWSLGWEVNADVFRPYASAVDDLAAWELGQLPQKAPRPVVVEAAVVGTVVFEAALAALRRLAQEHHSAMRFERHPAREPGQRVRTTRAPEAQQRSEWSRGQ